jgi:septal ring factor EnvC (AmiA/AmiB activator)
LAPQAGPAIDSEGRTTILRVMQNKKQIQPDSFLSRIFHGLLVYALFSGILTVIFVSVLSGKFPPSRADFSEQYKKMQGFMEKSDQVLTGLQKTNQELLALGPQLELIANKITELSQKVQILESEVDHLKSQRK